MAVTTHNPDGTDSEGHGLEITIRIAPDGRVYFHDITADLLPVAVALAPEDAVLRARAERARSFRQEQNR